ncbi:serine hydrolase domain-containing protein [Phenylobacterium sp. 58.2.17]|uniref:serine hydrolase domain-containing protein n=1 Tax=Phenylobacterium sp. 58.2.17 TaxID=2969306 RepID=UPI002263C035|nr:serine hydrolase [Phenylobacterium sp. 58.2.17]MCX7586340.1 serine hydrolase [Phenylobacterium sp. 58.2.17]
MRVPLIAIAAALSAAVPALAASPDCAGLQAYSEARGGASLLVLVNGQVVCEAYAQGTAATTPSPLYSGTKSLVALMAAAAVEDGLLTLDELAGESLPEWREDPLKSRVTLRQLLAMSAGLPSKIGEVPTYAAAIEAPFNAEPGERFQYGPAPYQAFGEIMRRKLEAKRLEADPLTYLERRVLQPAGAVAAAWRRGDDGQAMMPQGAAMTARDWAKIGEQVRIGSLAYRDLFLPSPANPGYGLGWWLPHRGLGALTAATDLADGGETIPRDLVMAAGAGDQRLYVIASRHLVIVRQARLDLSSRSTWSDAAFVRLALNPATP